MSSRRQGLLPKLTIPTALFRSGINQWPPFVGAGIRVTRVAADSREVGDKHEPTFRVNIVDAAGETVAQVTKTLYIRRRAAAAAVEA